MACTYDYSTRKVTLDFHLMKYGEVCLLRGKSFATRVGSVGCSMCIYNNGSETMAHYMDYFVKCKHPEAKDSEGCGDLKSCIYDRVELMALRNMYD